MFLWMFLSVATAGVFGFAVTRFITVQYLGGALIGAVFLPVAAYTLWFMNLPAAGENAFSWWMVGLIYLFVPMVFWLIGIVVGYRFGKRQG